MIDQDRLGGTTPISTYIGSYYKNQLQSSNYCHSVPVHAAAALEKERSELDVRKN
jgi:hypothetical protein